MIKLKEKLTQEEKDKRLASKMMKLFKDAMLAKESYTTRWLTYLNAWDNSLYTDQHVPSYRTNHVSNFIYSTIESMRPVLFDQNPRFEAIPVTADAMPYSNDINTILDWEWHRTNMQEICLANSIYTFALGTSVIMLKYDYSNGTDGDVTPIKVSPFNIYPDPLATCVEDAEYIIYADYMHVNKLKQLYPTYADKLIGSEVQFSELVNERNEGANIKNQVLILEVWHRDYSTITEENEDGNKKTVSKYPKGRVITCAPELGLILEDKPNPYDTGRFPFFLFKDIDVPFQFWGEGEVKWLLSPQQQANDLYNQILDNAKHTGNAQWIIDKNAGIPRGELTNRPGLIIRKNPGSEVRRESPPSMPMYVSQMIDTLKSDVEVISGVHDVTRGQTPTGVQSAAAIQALQEAAQTRIRLKVTLHENALGILGTEWLARIKQFWKFNRVVPQKVDESKLLPQMQLNGMEMQPTHNVTGAEPTYKMIEVGQEQINHQYRVKVHGASVMQSSRAIMLDQMIRLMQTPAEDGMPCVPREAVLDYLPDVNKRLIMQYFQGLKEEQNQQQQQQMMNNESLQQVQMLQEQVGQLTQMVQQLQSRADQEDKNLEHDEILAQGYQQGINEAQAMQKQLEKQGTIPPELYEMIAEMDDEELGMLLQQNPELADILLQE